MTLHLVEISQAVAPGAHAVVLLDQAGWHLSAKLTVPTNITLLPLPAKSPELNPVENIWQFIRENWLSNRIFTLIPRHSRPLLLRLEQPHRSALAHNLHRLARLGPSVTVIGKWYKSDIDRMVKTLESFRDSVPAHVRQLLRLLAARCGELEARLEGVEGNRIFRGVRQCAVKM